MTLVDISAGGLGFWSPVYLAPETILEVPAVFEESGRHGTGFRLKVRWCRRLKQGFRVGAKFEFRTGAEQDAMVRLINRFQIKRLSRQARVRHPS